MRAGARVLAITVLSAATAALLLTGCGSTPEEDLADWWSSGGETRVQNLLDDVSSVNQARTTPSAVLGDACRKLRTHVTEADEYDPIPDEDIQEFWADALASFRRGAPDCIAGADKQDDVLATQGVSEITGDGLRNLGSTASLLRRSTKDQ
ncbi:hypothetical protein [Streptomyces neyagawaensis]|uniref:hypothetical protein n=1 Tax=Streptomyces neyagawaensis TaxID=42238 RepID=UPI0006E43D67|nr:hypothetical protein [Streptomyces neyagawaensis]MCL6731217.1 hypothetical protein [Streptomyces neyagawaensis]MDE1683660.1 hypothetical protein [Streptomyces neyagawaensis]